MKNHWLRFALLSIIFCLLGSPAVAKVGRLVTYSIAETLKRGNVDEKFKKRGIELYWANQVPSRAIAKEIEEDTFTKSASVFARSEKGACGAAFEELFEKLILEAEERGANALVGLRSFHDEVSEDYSSETEFRCDVGKFRVVVGFRMRFVKLAP
jgi:uncharacterized protein YbjQ (UPF0145 family)